MPKSDRDEGNRKECAARAPIAEIEAVLSDPEPIVTPQFALSASDDSRRGGAALSRDGQKP
jgi:hypothetical protein